MVPGLSPWTEGGGCVHAGDTDGFAREADHLLRAPRHRLRRKERVSLVPDAENSARA